MRTAGERKNYAIKSNLRTDFVKNRLIFNAKARIWEKMCQPENTKMPFQVDLTESLSAANPLGQ